MSDGSVGVRKDVAEDRKAPEDNTNRLEANSAVRKKVFEEVVIEGNRWSSLAKQTKLVL